MGHAASKAALFGLQRRLDKMPLGNPAHRALFEILEVLFTEEECRLASEMPFRLFTAGRLSRIVKRPQAEVEAILARLVEKGLVADLRRDEGAKATFFLNPAVIGYFEFTMMRKRPEIDQAKVARLMWEYLVEDPAQGFLRMAAMGPTFVARPLVHEDTLEPEVTTEILDHQRASALVEQSNAWAEGLCHCRHVKLHAGERCKVPLGMCLVLGQGATALVRAGIAKPIERARALEILENARERGLVQMGDNVQNHPTFICNCCKCCCEMLEGFRSLPQAEWVVSSGFAAEIDEATCTGCGRCVRACPVDVIDRVPAEPSPQAPKRKQRAQVNQALCLGCGVCRRGCRSGALHLRPLKARIYTPESSIAKMVAMAVERGKLGNLLFDDHTRITHRTLAAFLNGLLKLPPAKQLLAQRQVKSTFINLLLEGVRTTSRSARAEEEG